MRTYGTLLWAESDRRDGIGRPVFGVRCEPHVMVRLKRLFPRANQRRTGTLLIHDTPEVARDLEWLMGRWPLDLSEVVQRRLTDQADAHRATEQDLARILEGHLPPTEWREPIRPARPYQLVADAVLARTGALLLLDEVGLGKSMSAILRLRDPAALPALVVTLTHLPEQWLEELAITLPWLDGHIIRRGTPYDPTDLRGVLRTPDVLICNYAKLHGWGDHLAGKVRTVIFDEVQELRSGEGTAKHAAASVVAHAATWTSGLSATPIYNYAGEAYNIMEVLSPGALGTREEFIREWGSTMSSGHVKIHDPAALSTYLRDLGVMLGRTRKEVGRELPETIPILHTVDVDAAELDAAIEASGALDFARLILDTDTARKDRFLASGEIDWRMRQATGVAKAPYVAEFVKLLLESEDKIVLYGWHRACYDVWLDRLADYAPTLYTGSESPRQKRRSKDAFLKGESRVLLMSLRAGAGLDGLQKASKVAVFGELDWSPQVHTQCEGRLSRDGMGEDPVVAYYLVTEDGSDPVVMDVLGIKRRQSQPFVRPDEAVGRVLAGVSHGDRIRRLAAAALERQR